MTGPDRSEFRPVAIRPRTGDQGNGHQSYHIGVPWQIAEAIPSDQKFVPSIDQTTGVLTFTPTAEPEQLVSFGRVMVALVVAGVPAETLTEVRHLIRGCPETVASTGEARDA